MSDTYIQEAADALPSNFTMRVTDLGVTLRAKWIKGDGSHEAVKIVTWADIKNARFNPITAMIETMRESRGMSDA